MRIAISTATAILSAIVPSVYLEAAAPAGFTETTYVQNNGIQNATGMAWAPDESNRLFIIRKDGTVRIIQNGALQATPFATMSVYTNSECGLIGICFDPDFLSNRYVYLFRTISSSTQQIVRYTDENGVGTNATVIVDNLPTAGQNHDGGGIGIGPDGYLYWSIGDLGNGTGVDNDLTSLAAKVGRANRFTGAPIADNPYNDGVGPNNEFIWARGFRNPFTLTFHPVSGDLWVNTVGTAYEQVFLVNRGDHAGYNDYENNQPAGYLTPKIVYRTNGTDQRTLTASGASRLNNAVTFSTTSDHRFRVGQQITISGVPSPSFNGTFFVQSVPTARTFTVAQVGADGDSGGGAATTSALGGAITGGAFYDSTLFASEYRGNFFFGDYNSGQITRATIHANTEVTSAAEFLTGASANVDVSVGPDGALYYVGVSGGTVKRLVPATPTDTLVVQPTAIRVQEGGRSLFTVSLAKAPVSPVTVQVTKRLGGDAELGTTVATLTFTDQNWNQLQSVEIEGGLDLDQENGQANFDLTASGYDAQSVLAIEIDGATERTFSQSLLYHTGGQVPGEDEGTVFQSFGLPALDGSKVGFLTTIQSAAGRIPAIFGGATPGILTRKDADAPGTSGKFSTFKDPVFGGGYYTFIGKLKSGSGVNSRNDDGIWSDLSGSLDLVAREGGEAPGTGGALFQSFVSIAMPASGDALFIAKLRPGTGTGTRAERVNSGNDSGIWRATDEGVDLVLREGSLIEVGPDDSRKVKKFQSLGMVKGSPDQRRSHTADGGIQALVDFTDRSQAIVEAPGSGGPLVVKALIGEGVSVPAGETLAKLGLSAANTSATAFRGVLALSPNITKANDTALFLEGVGGSFAAVVSEGGLAPSTGDAQFLDFSVPAVSSSDPAITFHATLRKGTGDPVTKSSSDTGLWTTMGGDLALIAREGSLAEGTTAYFTKFHSFAVHPDGEINAIAFTADLRKAKGQATSRNSSGLWALDRNHELHLLQRTGAAVQLPGVPETDVISQLALKASVNSAGQGRALNDVGQIVYLSKFRRGGQGIFITDMPYAPPAP